jgi:hypothetical protein
MRIVATLAGLFLVLNGLYTNDERGNYIASLGILLLIVNLLTWVKKAK